MSVPDDVDVVQVLTSDERSDVIGAIRDQGVEHGAVVNVHHVSDGVQWTDGPDAKDVLGLVVGGDGTFLEGVREFAPYGVPLLAVNTGTLGFLARIEADDAVDAVDEALSGEATVIEREQLSMTGGDLDARGINDVMVTPTAPENPTDRKICRVHVWIGGEYAGAYDGDGVAVSTPTGSTGVALSAGGPIHYPNDNHSLQVTALNTHNVGVRPVIASADSMIRLVPDDEVQVMVDGGRSYEVVDPGTELFVSGADQSAKIVRTSYDESFFDALSGSLGWGLRGVDESGPY